MNYIQAAAALLTNAQHICVLTGAGISAESGIATFRDKQTGLWENYKAEELASASGFLANPELVWQWYQMRRQSIVNKQPNAGHTALAALQSHCEQQGKSFTLISQNVDDLHEKAGSQPLKIHGSIMKNHCHDCLAAYTGEFLHTQALIYCSHCGGLLRPSVVWFGEGLPTHTWQLAENATAHADVFLSIGTSSLVYPAAGLISLAKQQGASVVEINPNPTHLPHIDVQIASKAGEALPQLVTALSYSKSTT